MFSLPPLLSPAHITGQPAPYAPACVVSTAAGALAALAAWYPGHWQALLLLLPAAWSRMRGRAAAFAVWMGYYLAGARDIPAVSMRFFSGYGELTRPEALVLGVALWIAQACVLATPWAMLKPKSNASAARHALCAAIATMLVTVPPLGIIGWLSPAYVASALFPGWKAPGLVLGITATACAASVSRARFARQFATLLLMLSVIARSVASVPVVPSRWTALDTRLGRFDQSSYASLYARTQQVRAIAQRAFSEGATVVVLPEEIVGLWRPAMGYWWRDDIQAFAAAKRTLIVGVDLTASGTPFRYTDSAVVVGADHGRLDSRQPVPAALWRPGAAVSAIRGSLTQPYVMVAGESVAFSICYEDLLWWPHWRILLQSPDVLVSLSNSWFDSDLALAHIQRQGIAAIARLSGVPLLRAVNR
ncbi:apolipoprotein N-acyltransferase [Trinickia symbiotica]|uniref:Conjugal transfer protein TraB n=1 Tax=Trinickia symbiotica TaxID=863227 RepID=A0A2N7WT60_9BURK|nr:conjugal transfer protein TraB [Trinickia symbiotica]PMS32663.1 conjugal transfer protein TraB [Trinickia symbiotica]PPK41777.1 apolipoprotein N-acyltransferase [Trinickia symbiotica]